MNEFTKIYKERCGIIEKEGKEVESYSNYKNMEEYIPNESDNTHIYLAENINDFNQNESPSINQANTEEIVYELDTAQIRSIKENTQRVVMIQPKLVYEPGEQSFSTPIIAYTNTKDETQEKKKGPKTQDSTKKHTKYFPDNNRCKVVTSFTENIFNAAQKRCDIYKLSLNKNDIKRKQFGFNTIHYNNFINAKLYQILGYEDEHNQEVIKTMCEEKKDEAFIFLMSCTFEYQYNKYINGDTIIHLDENEISLTPFEEVVEKKRTKLIKKKEGGKEGSPLAIEDYEDIDKEINDFIYYSKNFLKDIQGEGELIKRKPKNTLFCTYEEIDLFEKYYKSKIMSGT